MAEELYCVHCGSKASDIGRFCAKCGNELVLPDTSAEEPKSVPTTKSIEAQVLVQALPSGLHYDSISDLAPEVVVRGSSQSFKKVVILCAFVYLTAVLLTFALHHEAEIERKIAEQISGLETEVAQVIYNRQERNPRLIELVRWPSENQDNSVPSYLQRCRELDSLLGAELQAVRHLQERAKELASSMPTGSPSRHRIELLKRLAEEDVHLYELFSEEVKEASLVESLPLSEQYGQIMKRIGAVWERQQSLVKEKQQTIDQINSLQ
jgi:hypothetical protein